MAKKKKSNVKPRAHKELSMSLEQFKQYVYEGFNSIIHVHGKEASSFYDVDRYNTSIFNKPIYQDVGHAYHQSEPEYYKNQAVYYHYYNLITQIISQSLTIQYDDRGAPTDVNFNIWYFSTEMNHLFNTTVAPWHNELVNSAEKLRHSLSSGQSYNLTDTTAKNIANINGLTNCLSDLFTNRIILPGCNNSPIVSKYIVDNVLTHTKVFTNYESLQELNHFSYNYLGAVRDSNIDINKKQKALLTALRAYSDVDLESAGISRHLPKELSPTDFSLLSSALERRGNNYIISPRKLADNLSKMREVHIKELAKQGRLPSDQVRKEEVLNTHLKKLSPQTKQQMGIWGHWIPADVREALLNTIEKDGAGRYYVNAAKMKETQKILRQHKKVAVLQHKDSSNTVGFKKHEETIPEKDPSLLNVAGKYSPATFRANLSKLQDDDPVALRLNGSDFQKLYIDGRITLTHIKYLNLPQSILTKLSKAKTKSEERAARIQVVNYLKKTHVSYAVEPSKKIKHSYVLDCSPNNIVLSASQVAAVTSGISYDNNRTNATSYGTANHKFIELWSQNLIKEGSLDELDRLYRRRAISTDDLFAMGCGVYQGHVVPLAPKYFVNNKFKGMSNIFKYRDYFAKLYPTTKYKVELIGVEREKSSKDSNGGRYNATLDVIYKITPRDNPENWWYEVRDYKSGSERKGGGRGGLIEIGYQGATLVSKLPDATPDRIKTMIIPLGLKGNQFHPVEGRVFTEQELKSLMKEAKRGEVTKMSPYGMSVRFETRDYDIGPASSLKEDLKNYKLVQFLENERAKNPQKRVIHQTEDVGGEKFEVTYRYNLKDQKWVATYHNVMTVGNMTMGEIFKTANNIEKELTKSKGADIAKEVASAFIEDRMEVINKAGQEARRKAYTSLWTTDSKNKKQFKYTGDYADLARSLTDRQASLGFSYENDEVKTAMFKGYSMSYWMRQALGIKSDWERGSLHKNQKGEARKLLKTLALTEYNGYRIPQGVKKSVDSWIEINDKQIGHDLAYYNQVRGALKFYKNEIKVLRNEIKAAQENIKALGASDPVNFDRERWNQENLLLNKLESELKHYQSLAENEINKQKKIKTPEFLSTYKSIRPFYSKLRKDFLRHADKDLFTPMLTNGSEISDKFFKALSFYESLLDMDPRSSVDINRFIIANRATDPIVVQWARDLNKASAKVEQANEEIRKLDKLPFDQKYDKVGNMTFVNSEWARKRADAVRKRNEFFIQEQSLIYSTANKILADPRYVKHPDRYNKLISPDIEENWKDINKVLFNELKDPKFLSAAIGKNNQQFLRQLFQDKGYLLWKAKQSDSSFKEDYDQELTGKMFSRLLSQNPGIWTGEHKGSSFQDQFEKENEAIEKYGADWSQTRIRENSYEYYQIIQAIDEIFESMKSKSSFTRFEEIKTVAAIVVGGRTKMHLSDLTPIQNALYQHVLSEIDMNTTPGSTMRKTLLSGLHSVISISDGSDFTHVLINSLDFPSIVPDIKVAIKSNKATRTNTVLVKSTKGEILDSLEKAKGNIRVRDLDMLAYSIGVMIGKEKQIASWKSLVAAYETNGLKDVDIPIEGLLVNLSKVSKEIVQAFQNNLLGPVLLDPTIWTTASGSKESRSPLSSDQDKESKSLLPSDQIDENEYISIQDAEDYEEVLQDLNKQLANLGQQIGEAKGSTISITKLIRQVQKKLQWVYSNEKLLEAANIPDKAIAKILITSNNAKNIKSARRFFIFDLETGNLSTTGLNPIMQIGLILNDGTKKLYNIDSYGNASSYSKEALEKTGLSNKVMKELAAQGKTISISKALFKFADSLKKSGFNIKTDVIGGYNSAAFDMPVLLNTLNMLAINPGFSNDEYAKRAIKTFTTLGIIKPIYGVPGSKTITRIEWNDSLRSMDVYQGINIYDRSQAVLFENADKPGSSSTLMEVLFSKIKDGISNLQLETIGGYFGLFKEGAHNAGEDAFVTWVLAQILHYGSRNPKYLDHLVDIAVFVNNAKERGELTLNLVEAALNPQKRGLYTSFVRKLEMNGGEVFKTMEGSGSTTVLPPSILLKTPHKIDMIRNLYQYMHIYGHSANLSSFTKLLEKGVVDRMGDYSISKLLKAGGGRNAIGYVLEGGTGVIEFGDGIRLYNPNFGGGDIGALTANINNPHKRPKLSMENWFELTDLNQGLGYGNYQSIASLLEERAGDLQELATLEEDLKIAEALLAQEASPGKQRKMQGNINATKNKIEKLKAKTNNIGGYMNRAGISSIYKEAYKEASGRFTAQGTRAPGDVSAILDEIDKSFAEDKQNKEFQDDLHTYKEASALHRQNAEIVAKLQAKTEKLTAEESKQLSAAIAAETKYGNDASQALQRMESSALTPPQERALEQAKLDVSKKDPGTLLQDALTDQFENSLSNWEKYTKASIGYTQEAAELASQGETDASNQAKALADMSKKMATDAEKATNKAAEKMGAKNITDPQKLRMANAKYQADTAPSYDKVLEKYNADKVKRDTADQERNFNKDVSNLARATNYANVLGRQAAYAEASGNPERAAQLETLRAQYIGQRDSLKAKLANDPNLTPEQRMEYQQIDINDAMTTSQNATYALQNYQHTVGAQAEAIKKSRSIFTPVKQMGAFQQLAQSYGAVREGQYAEAQRYIQDLRANGDNAKANLIEAQMKVSDQQALMAQNPYESAKMYLGNAISNYMHWQIPMMMVSKVVNKMKELIQLAKQLDSAAVDIQIVTGKSREEVDQLMLSYSGLAKELGATTQEVARAANLWMRQGYDTAEVNELVTASMALSKLGMIEAGEATKYLTSMLKGFNLEASDSMDIVSKLTKIDMNYAASAGQIAEALSQTAVSARLAGVDVDSIIGYATEIIETSQASPSRVGNALKTMFSRYGNVKAGVFTGMSLLDTDEGDSSSTENINDIEKVLRKLGISIRSSSLEMRSFEDVIGEVAEKWQTLNSVSKNAVATALGGTRQREFVNILLENYSTAEEITEMSQGASGTAETKYGAYLNSVEAAQKRMISSWEGFIQKIEASNLLKMLYNIASILIDVAPMLLRALSTKFILDRVQGRSMPAVGMTPMAGGGFRLGFVSSKSPASGAASPTIEKGYYQDQNGTWHRPNGQFASKDEVAKHQAQISEKNTPARPQIQKFNPGQSAAIGAVAGVTTAFMSSGDWKTKAAKGLAVGGGTALGAMIGGPIGAALGSSLGDMIGTIADDIIHSDEKSREKQLQEATNTITESLDNIGKIADLSRMALGASLTSSDIKSVQAAATEIGSSVFGSAAGLSTWNSLMGASNDYASAQRSLQNILTNGSPMEKQKAINALYAANAKMSESSYEVKQNDLWRQYYQDTNEDLGEIILHALPGFLGGGGATLSRNAFLDAQGTNSWWHNLTGGAFENLDNGPLYEGLYKVLAGIGFTASHVLSTGLLDSAFESGGVGGVFGAAINSKDKIWNSVIDFMSKKGWWSGSIATGTLTQAMLEEGYTDNMNELMNYIESIQDNTGATKEEIKAAKSYFSNQISGAANQLQEIINLQSEARGQRLEYAYRTMAMNSMYGGETLSKLSLNQIIAIIAQSLAEQGESVYEADGTTITASMRTEIKNYLKTIDALNSRFSSKDSSIAQLLDRWKELKALDQTLPGIAEDLLEVEENLRTVGATFGITANNVEQLTDELKALSPAMQNLTMGDLFKNSTQVWEDIVAIETIMDKIRSNQALNNEDHLKLLSLAPTYGTTGSYTSLNAMIGDLGARRSSLNNLYKQKLSEDIMSSGPLYQAVIAQMKNIPGFADILTVWNQNNVSSFMDLINSGFYAEGDYQNSEWYQFIRKFFANYTTTDEYKQKQVQNARKVWEYDLNNTIDNLTRQKEALQDINKQREYELQLIKAKQKLEDAKNNKTRVWREGVGWVYEANQEQVLAAEKELEELKNQKTLSNIDAEIKELEYAKEVMEKIASAKDIEGLRTEYNDFAGNLKTNNSFLQQVYSQWEAKMSLGDVLENVLTSNPGLTMAAATAENAYANIQRLTTGKNANLYKQAQEGIMNKDVSDWYQEYSGYVTQYTSAWAAVKGYEGWQQNYGNAAWVPQNEQVQLWTGYNPQWTAGTAAWTAGGNKADMSGYLRSNKVTSLTYWNGTSWATLNDFAEFQASGLKLSEFYPNLPGGTVLKTNDGKVYGLDYNGQTVKLTGVAQPKQNGDIGIGYGVGSSYPAIASGSLSFGGGSAFINENGTEGIITPQGTFTALPSGTGIVPADITKNVWALGEVAPNLLRSLASLEAKGIINNNNSSTTEDSLIINSLMIKMNADKDFNIDKFVKELKNAADLSRHY